MKRIFHHLAVLALGIGLSSAALAGEKSKTAIMYKPLQCGCCDVYARHLEKNGFDVEVKSLPYSQFKTMKKIAGVPERFEGCHTLMVDGYVVDGLVPMKTLNRLLTEKPKIRGITLPGMPVGTPGMPGRKTGPLTIYELSPGKPKIYAVE
jgi:hypothetical protein